MGPILKQVIETSCVSFLAFSSLSYLGPPGAHFTARAPSVQGMWSPREARVHVTLSRSLLWVACQNSSVLYLIFSENCDRLANPLQKQSLLR